MSSIVYLRGRPALPIWRLALTPEAELTLIALLSSVQVALVEPLRPLGEGIHRLLDLLLGRRLAQYNAGYVTKLCLRMLRNASSAPTVSVRIRECLMIQANHPQ